MPARESLPFLHGSEILSLAYSPDGQLLLTSSQDGRLQIFEAKTGLLVRQLLQDRSPASVPTWSPVGHRVAYVDGSELHVWEGKGLERHRSTPTHGPTTIARAVAWSPDGSWLAVGATAYSLGADERITLIDATSMTIAKQPSIQAVTGQDVVWMGFLDDHRLAARFEGRDGPLAILSAPEGHVLETWPTPPRAGPAVSYQRGLVVGCEETKLCVVDSKGSARPPLDIELHIQAIAIAPDARSAVVTAPGKVARVRVADGHRQAEADVGWVPQAVAISPDGAIVAHAAGRQVTLRRSRDLTRLSPPVQGHQAPIRQLLWPTPTRLISASAGKVCAWSTASPAAGNDPLWCRKLGPEGRFYEAYGFMAAAQGYDPISALRHTRAGIEVWTRKQRVHLDFDTGHPRVEPRSDVGTRIPAMFPTDGSVTLSQGTINVDPPGREPWSAELAASPTCVALTPDGKQLVTVQGETDELDIWDAATGHRLDHLEDAPHWHCAVSADGRVAAAGLSVMTPILVYDLTTGQQLRKLAGEQQTTGVTRSGLAFSPDGALLIEARRSEHGRDPGVHLLIAHDLEAASSSRPLPIDEGVDAVAFSPGSQRTLTLAVARTDGRIQRFALSAERK